jgi:hypothetical protein
VDLSEVRLDVVYAQTALPFLWIRMAQNYSRPELKGVFSIDVLNDLAPAALSQRALAPDRALATSEATGSEV